MRVSAGSPFLVPVGLTMPCPPPGAAAAAILRKGFLAIRKAGHLCVQTLTQPYTDYSGREKVMEVRTDAISPGEPLGCSLSWGAAAGTGTGHSAAAFVPSQVCASSSWTSGLKLGAPCEQPSSWWSSWGGSWQVRGGPRAPQGCTHGCSGTTIPVPHSGQRRAPSVSPQASPPSASKAARAGGGSRSTTSVPTASPPACSPASTATSSAGNDGGTGTSSVPCIPPWGAGLLALQGRDVQGIHRLVWLSPYPRR